MNEQQLQQILTIQQAIAAAATAAVINSLLNPQQAATNLATNPNSANALTEALQSSQNQLDLQQQRPDSRQDSPIATSSSPLANNPPINDANRIQDLLLQLQQQAALAGNTVGGPLSASTATQQQQAVLAAALNLNLGNNANNNNLPLQQQLQSHLTGSPLSQSPLSNRLQLSQTDFNSLATGSNISNQSVSPNKKLKNKQNQQSSIPPTPITPHQQRSSLDKLQHHTSTPKSHHSNIANLGRNNSSNSSSSSFLPNNVGLPRKLVRGQDVWLGRGAEQTRQILKCMWCGQSFRTLAEMTQHMRETQHYTNIISQEQITSWRQPDGTENTGTSKQNSSKQSSQNSRSINEHLDDLSERFNDSDDSYSHDDEPILSSKQHLQQRSSSSSGKSSKSPATSTINNSNNKSSVSARHASSSSSANESSLSAIRQLSTTPLKPVTKSRKRDNSNSEDGTIMSSDKRAKLEISTDSNGGVDESSNSPHSTSNTRSSSQQRVLNDLNENLEASKDNKIATDDDQNDMKQENLIDEDEMDSRSLSVRSEKIKQEDEGHDADNEDEKDELKVRIEKEITSDDENDEGNERNENENETDDETTTNEMKESSDNELRDNDENGGNEKEDGRDGDDEDGEEAKGQKNRLQVALNNSDAKFRKRSSRKAAQADITSSSSNKPAFVDGQKVDASGDPLSALETMVEKSFDPRLRPGIASGGILQRLGIDEEVCPPWQHINYANWYAAAAYGHPMAAALLAAGINLQNGIKLGKNLSSRKTDED